MVLPLARDVQCVALAGPHGGAVAPAAARLPVLGTGLPTVSCWLAAGCLEKVAHDLNLLLRVAATRQGQPTAGILDSRTLPSTPESGGRAAYDGHKRRKGTKVHLAVDTLGHLLGLLVTPMNRTGRRSEPKRLSP